MAKFVENIGIVLDDEEKETLRHSNSYASAPNEKSKEKMSSIPNLRKAIKENFVGWEIKEKQND